jgi:hypothetical protein
MAAHNIVVIHTMAGFFSNVDRDFHANGYKGLESHLGVRADGFTKQWQDLEFRADANGDGNDDCISIETEDHGPRFPSWTGSDVPPFTEEQIDAIVKHVTWICDKYGIPKQLIPDTKPGRRGIGYHRQGIAGNYPPPYTGIKVGGKIWSKATGKACPGDERIWQIINIIIPRVAGRQAGGGLLADLSEAAQKEIFKDISSDTDGRLREVTLATRNLVDGDFIDRDTPARAKFKTLLIGALGTGLKPVVEGVEPEVGQGSLIGPFKRIMREVLAEGTDDTPDAPPES